MALSNPLIRESGSESNCPRLPGLWPHSAFPLQTYDKTTPELTRLSLKKDAPDDSAEYSLKRGANDIKELAAQLGESKIILGGHDW